MGGWTEKAGNTMNERRLMDQILSVRYTDLEEERELCKKLLERSEQEQNMYENAFANVYLFDSNLALGDYSECNFFLARATYLCRDNLYEDLLLVLCNLAGLYYLKLNDEQMALQYYLEGLDLSEHLEDHETYAKLNNNIGIGFANREDWETGRMFFEKAYEAAEQNGKETSKDLIISYLCNLSEGCIRMGDLKNVERNLLHCSDLAGDKLYYRIRIGCSWCSYFAKKGDKENCIAKAQEMLDLEIEKYDNKFFACDMLEGFLISMMEIGSYDMAEDFLHRLESLLDDTPLSVQYRAHCLKIQYMEKSGAEIPTDIYIKYYELETEMQEVDDKVRAQSILSRIQLNNVLKERRAMKLESEALENASQIDELTGLYNRRYFNKLVSKALQNRQLKYLGYIMIDVDYFKQYNDHYGHFMGDKALKTVAKVISAHAGADITVSRYGGDEFVCLCQDIPDYEVDEYVKAVHKAMRKENIPHAKSECSDRVSLSIGYCSGLVESGRRAEQMLQKADEALYEAKKAGKDSYYRKNWDVWY